MPEGTPAPEAADPGPALEQAFGRIQAERMRDVPLLNPRLFVEAVGLRREVDAWVGVLITPWFINLVALPLRPQLEPVPVGVSTSRAFPNGVVDFLSAWESGLGAFQACSLLSPVTQVADQATARAIAHAVLADLYAAPGAALPPDTAQAPAPMSKRDFLLRPLRGANA
jgi:[NiFe] hydrogenase assembly HybE family chaperone